MRDTIGDFEVSTIGPDGGFVRYPETCLFNNVSGDSEVIGNYINMSEAEASHHAVVMALDFVINGRKEY